MTRFKATVNGQVPFTPEEEAEWDAREQAARLISEPNPEDILEVKNKRNLLLADSDWRALSDQVLSQEWKDYRQALRDVTDQPGYPEEVIWPTSPEETADA